MSEQSASQILGRHCSSAGDEVVALGGSGCKYKAGEGRMQLSSKSIKLPRSSTCDVAASLVFLEKSRSKRTAGVLFRVYEQGEVGGGMFSSEKKRVVEVKVIMGPLQLVAWRLISGFRKWMQKLVKGYLLDVLVHRRPVMLLWVLSYLQNKRWSVARKLSNGVNIVQESLPKHY